jgi:hypothetical protein
MSHREVRAAIAAVLERVPDIGVVLEFTAYADREADMAALYTVPTASGRQVRGWRIRRVSQRQTAIGSNYVIETSWRVEGFLSLSGGGATELDLDDLVDAIDDAFRADETLGGTVEGLDFGDQAGLQVEDLGPLMFAGVLCHGARLGLNTWQNIIRDQRARP